MTTTRETRRLDELTRDIAPAHDLWPAIARKIEAEGQLDAPRGATPARRRRGRPSMPWLPWLPWLPWAVTAGLAFIATGVWWSQRGGEAIEPELAAIGDPAIETERRRLAAEVPGVLDALPADARFGATQSLDAVRSARSQIVAALRRDGEDPALREWLRDNQQQEVRVLRAIVDVGTQTRAL